MIYGCAHYQTSGKLASTLDLQPPGIFLNERGCFGRPLDGHAPGWFQEVINEEGVGFGIRVEAVGVEMEKVSAGTGVGEVEVVGGAENGLVDTPGSGHAFEEGGLAGTEVAFESEDVVFRKDFGEVSGNVEGLFLGGSFDSFA